MHWALVPHYPPAQGAFFDHWNLYLLDEPTVHEFFLEQFKWMSAAKRPPARHVRVGGSVDSPYPWSP